MWWNMQKEFCWFKKIRTIFYPSPDNFQRSFQDDYKRRLARMWTTCTPVVDSCQCIAKPIQYCRVKKKKNQRSSLFITFQRERKSEFVYHLVRQWHKRSKTSSSRFTVSLLKTGLVHPIPKLNYIQLQTTNQMPKYVILFDYLICSMR